MRALAVLLTLLALGGCTPTDPDLAKPCGQRRAARVVIGTGQYAFETIGNDGGLPIETDPYLDTSLVWLTIGCQGLGPNVRVSYGITDTATDGGIATVLDQGEELTYDSDLDQDEAAGLYAYLAFDAGSPLDDQLDGGFNNPAQLVGRHVVFWAEVVDNTCPVDTGPDGGAARVRGVKSSSINGYDPTSCTGCLHQACTPQLADCGQDCLAMQTCLDTRCWSLSAIASVDEVACQIACEQLHPEGAPALIALANCVQASTCQPPCLGYSLDYMHCLHGQDNTALGGACGDANTACLASAACQAYQTCVTKTCTTLAECQACATVAGGAAGRALLEAYDQCIETTCVAQGWVPHINSTSD